MRASQYQPLEKSIFTIDDFKHSKSPKQSYICRYVQNALNWIKTKNLNSSEVFVVYLYWVHMLLFFLFGFGMLLIHQTLYVVNEVNVSIECIAFVAAVSQSVIPFDFVQFELMLFLQ